MSRYGALQIGLIWQRLSGFIDEAAQVFLRTSFSSVVRDNWDMALGLMDGQGRQIVQSSRSVPSFIGTMPRTLASMLERFPRERLAKLIDGREVVAGHGDREMPVWGAWFKEEAAEELGGAQGDEGSVARRVENLIAYVETLQVTP